MKKKLGRPESEQENRVTFSCMVKPATKAIIDSWPDSRGVSIDRLVEAGEVKLNYDTKG